MTPIETVTPRQYAVQLYNRALEVLRSDPVMAYRCAASAVEADGSFAEGWLLLGGVLADMKSYRAACSAYKSGLQCPELTDPMRMRLTVNLGHRLMQAGEMAEAENVTDDAIRMHGRLGTKAVGGDEGGAFALTNRSMIYTHRDMTGAAVVDARRGHDMVQDPMTAMGRAFAHLFHGDYAVGLEWFEARFPYKLPGYLTLPYPRWDGTAPCKTLIVMCEQGLGDTISFARFIPEAARLADRVIFQVQPEIAGFLEHVFPENVTVIPQSHVLPQADAWCPVFSLPVAMRLKTDEIKNWPGLPVEDFALGDVALQGFDAGRFNIAIAYGGAPANEIDVHRSIPPAEFLPLRDVPGVSLWSVQVGPRVKELHEAGMAALVRDVSPWIRDVRDTAAVLNQMDLVVTCESFVGHLAGALGVDCWVLCSHLGRDWRTGISGDRPLWYEKTRLFRQGPDLRWGPVVARAVTALKERMAAR